MAPWPCQKVKVELTPCLNVSQALSLGGCCAMGALPQNMVEGVPPQSHEGFTGLPMTLLVSFPTYHLLLFDLDSHHYFKCPLKSFLAPFPVSLHLFLSVMITKVLLQAPDHHRDAISVSYKNT